MQFFRSPKNALLIFYTLTAALGFAALLQLSLFIYQNIYTTIYDTDQILILRSMVTIETVDIAKFKKVMTSLENKKGLCDGLAESR